MSTTGSSSDFTTVPDSFGPPLIGALLRMPWDAVQAHMLAQLHGHGFDDFDASYLAVFQYPGPQGSRPSELAARLRMSKQALNHLLGRLERRGYLERRADPDSRRSKRIELSARGVSAVAVIRAAVAEMEERWAAELGPKRFEQLRILLLDLNQSLSGTDESRPARPSVRRTDP